MLRDALKIKELPESLQTYSLNLHQSKKRKIISLKTIKEDVLATNEDNLDMNEREMALFVNKFIKFLRKKNSRKLLKKTQKQGDIK
jgi:hypothetical protein